MNAALEKCQQITTKVELTVEQLEHLKTMRRSRRGRPPKITPEQIKQILKLIDEGELRLHEIAELFDCTHARISQFKKAHLAGEI